MQRMIRTGTLLALLMAAPAAKAGEPNDMFWVRTTDRSPEQVVAAIKSYAEANKWLYLAASRSRAAK